MDTSTEERDRSHHLSSDVARLSRALPFGAEGNVDKAMDLMFSHLPSEPRGWSLCETFLEHVSWAFQPLKRDEIVDEVLSPIYKARKRRTAAGSTIAHDISPHLLAVLFMVFALGALTDLTLEPCELC